MTHGSAPLGLIGFVNVCAGRRCAHASDAAAATRASRRARARGAANEGGPPELIIPLYLRGGQPVQKAKPPLLPVSSGGHALLRSFRPSRMTATTKMARKHECLGALEQ